MPNNGPISQKSDMAKRLEAVLIKCNALEGNQIAVPKDVKNRMVVLCKETEKIIKDIPDKKFQAAAKVNANSKAVGYYKKIKEGITKAYKNIKSFSYLKDFYGVLIASNGNAVRSGIKGYSDSIDKSFVKIGTIIKAVDERLEKNPKISKKSLEDSGKLEEAKDIESIKSEIYEKDKKLVEVGKIARGLQGSGLTYTDHVKVFFEDFIVYKVENYNIFIEQNNKLVPRSGVGLVQLFQDASYSFRRLKMLVAANEEDVYGNGIDATRNEAVAKMKNITTSLNALSKQIDESIIFLENLEIESSSINQKRADTVDELSKKKGKYKDDLYKINQCKDSVLYGETRIKSLGGGDRSAAGKGILAANTVRKYCNGFIARLNEALAEIRTGKEISKIISCDAKNLYEDVVKLSHNVTKFIENVNGFKGYFEKNAESEKILDQVMGAYKKLGENFDKMGKKINRSKTMDKLEDLQDKLVSELEDYNKTSSKIKRGIKKVGGVMLTIGKYALYVKGFINNMVGFSGDCVRLMGYMDIVESKIADGEKVEVKIVDLNYR